MSSAVIRMVLDPRDQLVCLIVYKRGAVEVVRRLAAEWGRPGCNEGMPRTGIPSFNMAQRSAYSTTQAAL